MTKVQKNEIAQNLIDILEKDVQITNETNKFVSNWILTCGNEKTKIYYDVWDIVLKNYLPKTKPVLFRSCSEIKNDGKIVSFTSCIEVANMFSQDKTNEYIIICDTKSTLLFEDEIYKVGEYKNTFFPLTDILIKAKEGGGWGFSNRILNNYQGEKEYIMRINLENMYCVKCIKNE